MPPRPRGSVRWSTGTPPSRQPPGRDSSRTSRSRQAVWQALSSFFCFALDHTKVCMYVSPPVAQGGGLRRCKVWCVLVFVENTRLVSFSYPVRLAGRENVIFATETGMRPCREANTGLAFVILKNNRVVSLKRSAASRTVQYALSKHLATFLRLAAKQCARLDVSARSWRTSSTP